MYVVFGRMRCGPVEFEMVVEFGDKYPFGTILEMSVAKEVDREIRQPGNVILEIRWGLGFRFGIRMGKVLILK